MSDVTKLKRKIKRKAQRKNLEYRGILGRADGTMTAGGQDVYITLMNGDVIAMHNDRVPLIRYRKIIFGYDASNPALLQVLRFDAVYSSEPFPQVGNHAAAHIWYGWDPVEVSGENFLPILPRAAGGLVVRVYGNQSGLVVDGTNIEFFTTDVDLSGEAVSSGAEWVNAEIDSAGAITFNHGSNVASREILTLADRPAVTSGMKLLFSVKMYAGQTDFIQIRTDSDIYDPRFTGEGMGAGGGGSSSPIFTRVLSADLTLLDTQCLVISGYLDLATFDLDLQGDSTLDIL